MAQPIIAKKRILRQTGRRNCQLHRAPRKPRLRKTSSRSSITAIAVRQVPQHRAAFKGSAAGDCQPRRFSRPVLLSATKPRRAKPCPCVFETHALKALPDHLVRVEKRQQRAPNPSVARCCHLLCLPPWYSLRPNREGPLPHLQSRTVEGVGGNNDCGIALVIARRIFIFKAASLGPENRSLSD